MSFVLVCLLYFLFFPYLSLGRQLCFFWFKTSGLFLRQTVRNYSCELLVHKRKLYIEFRINVKDSSLTSTEIFSTVASICAVVLLCNKAKLWMTLMDMNYDSSVTCGSPAGVILIINIIATPLSDLNQLYPRGQRKSRSIIMIFIWSTWGVLF